MRLVVLKNYDEIGKWAANYVAEKMKKFRERNSGKFVLGLPTGSTPLGMYIELIKLNSVGKISFSDTITFNMDEYIGLPENDPNSYHYYMYKNFFSSIDIKKENINILNGNSADPDKECEEYEKKIKSLGGTELFIGGIGANGHIAFNEPGSSLSSRTRVVLLSEKTIYDNSRFFGSDITRVPTKALSVGIGTVMDARSIMLLAAGKNKADALKTGIEKGINHLCPWSVTQIHPNTVIVCDKDAASGIDSDMKEMFSHNEKS